MLAIQLESFKQVEWISQYCLEEGLILDWFLHCDTALRLAPPLIITELEIKKACAIIIEALESYPQ